ncbi:15249_t:CDS:1, partial [Entrophospora sp. SA101]
MLDFLELKVEESSDLPKLSTVQGWITRHTAQIHLELKAKITND